MKEYLIVDGYNIINDWRDLKAIFRENVEAARDKLIEIMAEYKAYKGINVMIVFDGHRVRDNPGSSSCVNGVHVVYTKELETADSFIEKNVARLAKNTLVRVATSDWAEQQVILALGGIRVSAGELKGIVEGCNRDIKQRIGAKCADSINTVNGSLPPEVARKLQKWRKAP